MPATNARQNLERAPHSWWPRATALAVTGVTERDWPLAGVTAAAAVAFAYDPGARRAEGRACRDARRSRADDSGDGGHAHHSVIHCGSGNDRLERDVVVLARRRGGVFLRRPRRRGKATVCIAMRRALATHRPHDSIHPCVRGSRTGSRYRLADAAGSVRRRGVHAVRATAGAALRRTGFEA